jgi:sigma-E factor negative regulatory protein RseA
MPQIRDELKESLSALMDGEVSELEKRQILAALSSAERDQILKIWNRYQISSAIIKGEPILTDIDYRNDVSGSINSWFFVTSKPSYDVQDIIKQFGVAACVALITILSVQKYNGASLDRSPNSMPAQHVQVTEEKEPSLRHPAGFKPTINVQTVSAESSTLKLSERRKSAKETSQLKRSHLDQSSVKNLDELKKAEQTDDSRAVYGPDEDG